MPRRCSAARVRACWKETLLQGVDSGFRQNDGRAELADCTCLLLLLDWRRSEWQGNTGGRRCGKANVEARDDGAGGGGEGAA